MAASGDQFSQPFGLCELLGMTHVGNDLNSEFFGMNEMKMFCKMIFNVFSNDL